MQRLFSSCTNCIKNTYNPLSEEPPRSEPQDFIALIKNATTKDQLNSYEKEIENIEIKEAEEKTGYANGTSALSSNKFHEWQQEWWKIREKWESTRLLILNERLKKFPSHKTDPRRDYGPPYGDSKEEYYGRFRGGKKLTCRNIKNKRSKKSKKSKKTKRTKRTMKRLK
jgi:hypothetical protein